ncbi:uncharacterized protein LOC130629515 [Hydractinia symbiolongicarpus]|uniref:uncharacterized protein LOC130629515 n=1 Tax=Hydractinia symbiolongicarpus TaxID=13093 RepID=UPI00254A1883|nr:uncharacterized protein LOC130629515 [Hydractinia symbiolongicarpus]
MKAEGNEALEVGWQFLSTNYGTRNRGPVCRSFSPCELTEACVDTCFEDDQVGYQCIPNQFQKIPTLSMAAFPIHSSYPLKNLQDGHDSTYAGTFHDSTSHFRLDFGMVKFIRFITIRLVTTVRKAVITVDDKFCSWVPEVADVNFVVECNSLLSGQQVVLTHLDSSQAFLVSEMHFYGDV